MYFNYTNRRPQGKFCQNVDTVGLTYYIHLAPQLLKTYTHTYANKKHTYTHTNILFMKRHPL